MTIPYPIPTGAPADLPTDVFLTGFLSLMNEQVILRDFNSAPMGVEIGEEVVIVITGKEVVYDRELESRHLVLGARVVRVDELVHKEILSDWDHKFFRPFVEGEEIKLYLFDQGYRTMDSSGRLHDWTPFYVLSNRTDEGWKFRSFSRLPR